MLRAVRQILVTCIILGIAHLYEQHVVHISEETGTARRGTLQRVVQAVKRELASKGGESHETTPIAESMEGSANDRRKDESVINLEEKLRETTKDEPEASLEEVFIAIDQAETVEPLPSEGSPLNSHFEDIAVDSYNKIDEKEELHAVEESDATVPEPLGYQETTKEPRYSVDEHEKTLEEKTPPEQPYVDAGEEDMNPTFTNVEASTQEPLLQDEAGPEVDSADGDTDEVNPPEALWPDGEEVVEAQIGEHTASTDDAHISFQSPTSDVKPMENQAPQEDFDMYDELPAYMRDDSADNVLESTEPDGFPAEEPFTVKEKYPSDDFMELPEEEAHSFEDFAAPADSIHQLHDVEQNNNGNDDFEGELPWDSDEALSDDNAQCFAPDCTSDGSEPKVKRTKLTIALSAMQILFTQVLVYLSL